MNKLLNKFGLVLLAVLSTFLVWLPFHLKLNNFWGLDFSEGAFVLWKNFDGPNYLIIAKTWYDKVLIAKQFSNPLPVEYYPAHWPLYPAIIFVFNLLFDGPWAMLMAGVAGVGLFYWVLPKFLLKFGVKKENIFWLGIVSLVLPARWIALRSIGSPEGWFMAFILLALISYKNKKYWWAGLWGSLAQLSKSPAILLFAGFVVYELINSWEKQWEGGIKRLIKRLIPIGLMPLAILLVFSFYGVRTGNFWAYFNSGDNFHLFWPPFSIFGRGGIWVEDFWLEGIIWLWLIYGVGSLRLWRKNQKLLAVFAMIFFVSTLFVSHRDLSRYIIPIFPLMLVSYKSVLVKKEFKWMIVVMLIPVFLFALNFILNNVAPVADWAPYL